MINASFLTSKSAPQYIIWDIREGVAGIDGRHIFFDEPISLQVILSNYKKISQTDKILILQKQSSSTHTKTQSSKSTNLEWNKWAGINEQIQTTELTYITYEPNLKQKVGALIFRPEPLILEVKKKSGIIYKFRIVPENAKEGLMLQQLPFDTDELASVFKGERLNDTVTQVRLTGSNKGKITIAQSKISQ